MEGLAIAPFVGKLLLDYGANVVRIDRKGGTPHYGTTALEHGKTVIQFYSFSMCPTQEKLHQSAVIPRQESVPAWFGFDFFNMV